VAIAAGVALALAIVTTIVVGGRSSPAPAAPPLASGRIRVLAAALEVEPVDVFGAQRAVHIERVPRGYGQW
jgi:hypothetical protein